MIRIRKAENKDIPAIMGMLLQVLNIHAAIRPDIFIPDTTKYTVEELEEIIADPQRPIFIAADDDDNAVGYAFCAFRKRAHENNMTDILTLYIDDLCVDRNLRGQKIGNKLYEHVISFAKESGCYHVTLNVWEGNDAARSFYEKEGFKVLSTTMEKIL